MLQRFLLQAALLSLACCHLQCDSNEREPEEEKPQDPCFHDTGYYDYVVVPPMPSDWPYPDEWFDALRYSVHIRYFNPNTLIRSGLTSRKEIVRFARSLLRYELDPELDPDEYQAREIALTGAYDLLGIYGSLEDARMHFEAVKAIDASVEVEAVRDEQGFFLYQNSPAVTYGDMIESLGYYLMRDHFMPAKDRKLMREIEDYLYRCMDPQKPHCWGREDMDGLLDHYRLSAEDGFNLSCSDRANARLEEIREEIKGTWYEEVDYFNTDAIRCINSRQDKIRAYFPPVLPEEELENW